MNPRYVWNDRRHPLAQVSPGANGTGDWWGPQAGARAAPASKEGLMVIIGDKVFLWRGIRGDAEKKEVVASLTGCDGEDAYTDNDIRGSGQLVPMRYWRQWNRVWSVFAFPFPKIIIIMMKCFLRSYTHHIMTHDKNSFLF